MKICDFCKSEAKYKRPYDKTACVYVCEQHAAKLFPNLALESISPTEITTAAVCTLCGEEKPVDKFYAYTDARGVRRRRSECKECNLAERKKQRLRRG